MNDFLGQTIPQGFRAVYGEPPRSEQFHDDRPRNWQEAKNLYLQWLKNWRGVLDISGDEVLQNQVDRLSKYGGFGPALLFVVVNTVQGESKERVLIAFPDTQIEDGLDEDNPMEGVRPLVYHAAAGALTAPGSLIAVVQEDFINRGIAVDNPWPFLTPELRKKNAELLAQREKTTQERLEKAMKAHLEKAA